MEKQDFEFEPRTVYGTEIFYPLSESAKKLLVLFKRKTLNILDLCELKSLNLPIVIKRNISKYDF